jgi:hypothetical protein
MKKILLMSLFGLGISTAAFGQGSVNWASISAGNVTIQTNSSTYSPLFGGGSTGSGGVAAGGTGSSFYYELLDLGGFNGSTVGIAPTTVSSLSNWQDSGLGATNSNTAGRLTPIAGNGGATTPVGWNTGTTNYIMLVGWSANLGTTWSAALATLNSSSLLSAVNGQAFFGMSNLGYINPFAVGVSPGAVLFGNGAQSAAGLPIFSLNTQLYLVPVPEPGTIALATLGGLSMLALRRRKA